MRFDLIIQYESDVYDSLVYPKEKARKTELLKAHEDSFFKSSSRIIFRNF